MNRRYDIIWWAALYLFFVFVLQNRVITLSRSMTVQFCYLAFIAANYYFQVFFGIPHFLHRKQYFLFVSSLIAGIVITAALRVPLVVYMNSHVFASGGAGQALSGIGGQGLSGIFFSSLLNIGIWVILLLSAKLLLDRMRLQQRFDKMEKEKTKAELDFLNAQFNPHFLFNSINSIYAHIDKHNPTARNMLLSFSEMLRYQLYDCNTNYISVDKEMSYIRNYVAIQQTRKESRVKVCLTIGESVTGFFITPLLFIAFIENAFKYVSDHEDRDNRVVIAFERKDNELLFYCHNTKEAGNGHGIEHNGIGIANARRRMALLYPGRHALDIVDNEEMYEVTVNLQLL
jgi:hypothetical protein